jgi:truncated hemoglobin YjbI
MVYTVSFPVTRIDIYVRNTCTYDKSMESTTVEHCYYEPSCSGHWSHTSTVPRSSERRDHHEIWTCSLQSVVRTTSASCLPVRFNLYCSQQKRSHISVGSIQLIFNYATHQQLGKHKKHSLTMARDASAATLYERLGGDPFMDGFTIAFVDEIVENEDLNPFFKNISSSALRVHQVKLFRVVFGREETKPSQEDLFDYLLTTHARLFRDLGMNEEHFDEFVRCLEEGLQILHTERPLIDECAATLAPLRTVFKYGALVAMQEKTMSQDEMIDLPQAGSDNIGTDIQVVLPEYSEMEVHPSLRIYLQKNSKTGSVRGWTCDLTNRFGTDGDHAIADTFLDQSYMAHQVYLIAFLELAFLSEDSESNFLSKALQIVLFPRGPSHSPLSRVLFDKMIAQFSLTCHMMGMSRFSVKTAETKLLRYRDCFALKTTLVGGVDAPHILKKKGQNSRKNKRSYRAKSLHIRQGEDLSTSDLSASLSQLIFDGNADSNSCSACSGFSPFSVASDLSLGSTLSLGSVEFTKCNSVRKQGKESGGIWSIFKSFRGGMKMKIPSAISGIKNFAA